MFRCNKIKYETTVKLTWTKMVISTIMKFEKLVKTLATVITMMRLELH